MTRQSRSVDIEREFDLESVQFHLKHAIEQMGFNLNSDEGVKDTPKRIGRMYQELLSGYSKTAEEVLGTTFPGEGYNSVVILKDIPFSSLCEHHFLPFIGTVSIAYLPGERVVGISKLARLVEMHAKRVQIQECLTDDIANDIDRVLLPKGVAVKIVASHTCMTIRGVNKPGSTMVTTVYRGVYETSLELRTEVRELLEGK